MKEKRRPLIWKGGRQRALLLHSKGEKARHALAAGREKKKGRTPRLPPPFARERERRGKIRSHLPARRNKKGKVASRCPTAPSGPKKGKEKGGTSSPEPKKKETVYARAERGTHAPAVRRKKKGLSCSRKRVSCPKKNRPRPEKKAAAFHVGTEREERGSHISQRRSTASRSAYGWRKEKDSVGARFVCVDLARRGKESRWLFSLKRSHFWGRRGATLLQGQETWKGGRERPPVDS